MKIKNLLDDNNTTEVKEENIKPPRLDVQLIQPWSNFIAKVKIPDIVFSDLEKLYVDAEKINKSFGSQLVGQIDNEPEVTQELKEKYSNFIQFCLHGVENYVRMSMQQTFVGKLDTKLQDYLNDDQILSRVTTMWFVNQKPGEYNPMHVHTNCKVSSVMYLRKPSRQIKGKKEHYKSDGQITFTNNTWTDLNFANAQCSFEPEPGDMFIFPALQHHMVWPYRSEDPNDSRISLSFNADWTTEKKLKREQENQEQMYQEMKKMKESENDKSVTDGNINKSG